MKVNDATTARRGGCRPRATLAPPTTTTGWSCPSRGTTARRCDRFCRPRLACFLSSPYHHPVFVDNELPASGYWSEIEAMCRKAGVVIVDDVRAGFRRSCRLPRRLRIPRPRLLRQGARQRSSGCRRDRHRRAETSRNRFYTGTQFFNAAPMAAAPRSGSSSRSTEPDASPSSVSRRRTGRRGGLTRPRPRVTGVPGMPYYRIAGDGLAPRPVGGRPRGPRRLPAQLPQPLRLRRPHRRRSTPDLDHRRPGIPCDRRVGGR